jgi:hypothetical protein
MTGTIKSLDPRGFGIINGQDGSKVPFLFSDVRNPHLFEVGQRVIFSVRRVQDKAFAENIGPEAARSGVNRVPLHRDI